MNRDQQISPPGGPPAAEEAHAVALRPEQFLRMRDLLAGYSGVYLDTTYQRVLETGLERRLRATSADLASYERYIGSSAGRDELRRLAELVLNHETFFFRNGPHMRALQEVLLPELHRRKQVGAPIRIWSAGCSTGEEAYSLAILAHETLGRLPTRPVEIWATDLSESALQKARAGFYRGRAIGNLPPDLLRRYFHPRGDGYVVADALRSLVRFELLNLLEPFPSSVQGVDIIFCQNVTIYFQLETCRKLIERFYECLPVGGLLFLGFSETLWNVFDRFQSREVAGAYVYYKGPSDSTTPAALAETRRGAQRTTDTLQPGRLRAESRPPGTPPAERQRTTAPLVPPDDKRSFRDQGAAVEGETSDAATLLRGRDLLTLGKSAEALEVLRHISPRSKCASQALTLVAQAHADRGDLDMAVAEIHRALEIDMLNEEAYLLLGTIYGRQGQWQAAVQQFERARYLRPASALVSFHLAGAYRQLGRIELASREYRNTLRKLDGHPPDTLLAGVAVGWLRETCQRLLDFLPHPT